MSMETKHILGVPIAQASYESTCACIREWLDGKPQVHSIVAANVHVVTESALNPVYAEAIRSADLIVPDGVPLVWASRMLGNRSASRCYGPALMEYVLADSEKTAGTHYLYGSTPDPLARLQSVISARWPKVTLVGAASPSFGPLVDEEELRNIQAINSAGPDILWIGTGCPKQELWMHQHRDRVNARVVAGVGAAFDYLAGVKPRPAAWVQKAGLEWAHRLCVEPRRLWQRYLFRNPYFVLQFCLQLAGLKWRPPVDSPG